MSFSDHEGIPRPLSQKQKARLRTLRAMVLATHWIQNSYYRLMRKKPTEPAKDCYCLTGLVNKVCDVRPLTGSNVSVVEQIKADYYYITRGQKVPESAKDRDRIIDVLTYLIRRKTRRGGFWNSIEEWNDADSRTRRHVVDLIDEALAYTGPAHA